MNSTSVTVVILSLAKVHENACKSSSVDWQVVLFA